MNPNEREILQKTLELTQENNKILHKMRRSARVSTFFRIVYWIIIIGAAYGTYVFIQPYINILSGAYNGIQNNINAVKNPINDLINKLK